MKNNPMKDFIFYKFLVFPSLMSIPGQQDNYYSSKISSNHVALGYMKWRQSYLQPQSGAFEQPAASFLVLLFGFIGLIDLSYFETISYNLSISFYNLSIFC